MTMNEQEHDALSVLAFVLLQSGRADKAAALLDGLDALTPGNAVTLQSLAVAQVRAGRPAEALQTLERLRIRDDSDNPIAWLVQAQALLALGRRADAQAAMARHLEALREPPPLRKDHTR